MANKRRQPFYRRYRLAIILSAIIIFAGLLFAYIYNRDNTPKITKTPTPTISNLPNQQSLSGSKAPATNTGVNQGTATDNHGQAAPVSTSPSQWTQSESGAITLKQPADGSSIKSGGTISGTAKVSQVQFRLIDDSVGVISQGFLSVVDGSFSGSMSFSSHSGSGRLDVFSTDPNGKEINEVQVAVNF